MCVFYVWMKKKKQEGKPNEMKRSKKKKEKQNRYNMQLVQTT